MKADHGFNVESKAIRDLVEIMGEYDARSRRAFLQFITGSPKLPIGGGTLTDLSTNFAHDIFRLPWFESSSNCCSQTP